MKHKSIPGIYDDNFEEFLKSIGELRDVLEGKHKCKICKSPITIENITYIFPESGSIKFVCNNPDCVKGYME